ncbi:MAG: DUF547 domain-containing protein [Balneolaceae bacterium]
MKSFLLTITLVIITNNLIVAQQNNLYEELLNDHVGQSSRVYYNNLVNDERLDQYLSSFQEVNVSAIDDDRKKALLINAYNAGTLKIAAEHYPTEKIENIYDGKLLLGRIFKKSPWDELIVNIAGERLSMNEIRKRLINLQDPRIAFLLFQPYIEGPKIIEKPVTSSNIEQYLVSRSDDFWNDQFNNVYDFGLRILIVSGILEIQRDFFPSKKESFIAYIVERVDLEIMAEFESHFASYGGRTNIKKAILADVDNNPEAWNLKYKTYPWVMNGLD